METLISSIMHATICVPGNFRTVAGKPQCHTGRVAP